MKIITKTAALNADVFPLFAKKTDSVAKMPSTRAKVKDRMSCAPKTSEEGF